jgi:uncharacterized protein
MTEISPPASVSSKPLSDDELDAYDDLINTLAERADLPISLEFIDGFSAALQSGPRVIAATEYLAALLGGVGLNLCENDAESALFSDCFARRLKEIERALNAPVDNLADPKALSPFILDWQALLAELPPAEREAARAEGVPDYASIWAEGFLFVVDTWADDWALPEGSKDEAFVDASLDSFYTLTTERAEWTKEEAKLSRDEHVAQAIWAVYDLREFWRDRGLKPETIRVEAKPGRNDECACGSGKKYKKCCGGGE